MSCTNYEEIWGQENLNGAYDESDQAYDSSTRTFDGVLYTDYTGDSAPSTSYSNDSDQSTTYTEEWAITQGTYDESAEAYDSSENTYDGIYFTVYSGDSDQSTSYIEIGLCMELVGTSGEQLLDSGGDNLVANNLE